MPLIKFAGAPEVLLERCAEKTEREAAQPREHSDLLTVAQVLAELRFSNPELLNLLGGQETMIESRLLQKMRAETM